MSPFVLNLGVFFLWALTAKIQAGDEPVSKFKPEDIGIDPSLPNILIIGDSISLHYTPFVVQELKGKANVFHSGGKWGCNAASTELSLKEQKTSGKSAAELWLEFKADTHFCGKKAPGAPKPRDYDLSRMGMKWDVVVANWGLWDISRSGPGADSRIATPIEEYRANLETLFEKMAATKAELVWVSTTPVPETNLRHRRDEDVIAYNLAAAEIAARHGARICDLYSLVKPKITPAWRKKGDPNDVHFSRELGSPFLGKQVASAVISSLGEAKENTK